MGTRHGVFRLACVIGLCLSLLQSHGQPNRRFQAGSAEAVVPSITGVARESFFSYASLVAVQLIRAKFKPTVVPPVQTLVHIPVVGTFDIDVEDVHVNSLDLSEQSTGLTLGADSTFIITANQLQATVDAHFTYRRTNFPHIKGGGGLHILLHDGIVQITIRVVNDGTGRPRIILASPVQVSFGSVDLVISQCKFAWLYNIVVQLAHNQVRDTIVREVEAQIATQLPATGNQVLAGIPTLVDVKGLQLNASMDGDPAVSADRLLVQDWGRFQSPTGAWQECPYRRAGAPLPISDPHAPVNASHAERMLMQRAAGDDLRHGVSRAGNWDPDAMMSALVDQSIVNCFTWVLYRQGKLDRYLEGDQAPNKLLFTNTWLPVIPQLVWYYPSQDMGMLVHVTAPPDTAMRAARGVSSTGNATLSFYLAKDGVSAQPVGSYAAQGADQADLNVFARILERLQPQGSSGQQGRLPEQWDLADWNASGLLSAGSQLAAQGKHLFTLNVGGELVAKDLTIEPDLPSRPEGFRLRIAMELVKSSLSIGVAQSDVGDINEDRLRVIMTLAAFLVEAKINGEILKDGFPLPDIPHVQVIKPGVQVVDYAMSLDSSVQYVP